jgi:glycine oxidase
MLVLAAGPGAPRFAIRSGLRYLVPRGDVVLVGATVEPGRDDAAVDAPALAGLRAFAAELSPALADAPQRGAWAGVRARASSGRPLIGRDASGAILALGLHRNGVLLAPAVAEIVAGLALTGAAADPRWSGFAPPAR